MTSPAQLASRALALVPEGMLIDASWRAAHDGRTFAVHDPATGEAVATVPDGGPVDVAAARDAACRAQEQWAEASARWRADLLRATFDMILERRDDLAALMTLEMGKPLAEAQGEIDYGAEFLRWFSEEATRIRGDLRLAPDGKSRLAVLRQPVGPTLLITPWNFPLAMATRKLAPALAAGCTTILKPAEQTPLTSLAVAAMLQEAGVPAGVVNVVTTTDPAALVDVALEGSRIRKLSFTGSTAVGRHLLQRAANGVLRTSMELGGNAPFLVFDDADLDSAVEGAMLAKLRNMGEACTAANRFLVQAGVADEFGARLAERMGDLRVGSGFDPDTEIGPLIDNEATGKVSSLLDDALTAGAKVLTGGSRLDGAGDFFEPTVVANVPAGARILREEVFGPVAPIMTFDTEVEAVERANDTEHGLAAYVYTRDLERGLRLGERLDVGMVALNRGLLSNAAAPFGGVKASGLGREGGFEGIDEFLETKYIAIDRPQEET